jgi:uncharacterized protein YkwD
MKSLRALSVAVLTATTLVTTCAASAPAAVASVAPAPTGSTASVAYVNRIVVLVNAQRTAHRLRPLTLSYCGAHYATTWSTHMAATGLLVHQSLTGLLRCPARMAGENIGEGTVSADQMMSMWMNSAGHRANILNPAFTRIGVGAVRTSSGRWWATQDFVTPLTGS